MLLKCPECGLQVSDKALSCPHCGYPMVLPSKPRKPYGQHRRLPNGFGRITKISGQNLRNPYRAMVTVGKTAEGRPISKILKPKGYFKTYNDAYAALVEYNKNPYDLSASITLKELYERWKPEHLKRYPTSSTKNSVESSWRYCSAIENINVADLRIRHIKDVINNGTYEGHTAQPSMKNKIKSMFNTMLDFAVEYELVDRNYARQFSINDEEPQQRIGHVAFTNEEIDTLWNNLDANPYVDMILIQIYGGWRPQELGLIKVKEVDLKKGIIIGGMKTDAGKERIVPIHPKISGLIAMRCRHAENIGSEYLFNCTDTRYKAYGTVMTYSRYKHRFYRILEQLGLDPSHRPHDGRKTFVTLAKKYKVDEYAIKYIVGHRINDITENVYTERNEEWLIEEVKKIE